MSTDTERHLIRGACPLDCPDTCSWEVTVEDGRAVALRGTRDHPFTRGSLCAKMTGYLDHTRAPDRLLHPLRRTGPKGQGQFERVTWEDALAEIADHLQTIITRDGGEAIWPYAGTGSLGFLQGDTGIGQRLWNTLGTSIHDENICSRAGSVGTVYTLGSREGIDPEECRRARFILLWGANPLTSHNHIWRFISEARTTGGAHVVVIDPIRTRTAEQADEHIALIPGSDAALALGLLNVVVTLGAQDQAYIDAHTLGWDAYRERINEYPPARVATLTGIPEETIRALGTRLAQTRPTALFTKMGVQRHAGGGMALRTIMTIPGVTGDWQYPGGGAVYSTGDYSKGNLTGLTRSDLRRPGTRKLTMSRLGRELLEADNPRVAALLVLGANPVASNPDQERVRRGLARADLFTVVVDHFQTDTADYADLVLPTTMQTEHADLHNAYGHLYLHWNEPAVPAPGECLPGTEIMRRLARHMQLTDPCLYAGDEDLARAYLDTADPSLAGITLERLKEHGWVRLNYAQPALAYPRGFPTPSGKIEFYSARAAADGLDPLPTYTPASQVADPERARRFPLALVTPASHYFLNSQFANKPDLAHHAGPIRVLLHPDDAAARRLANGDRACVYNDLGEFQAIVEITGSVRPGVAMSPKGYWPKLSGDRRNANTTIADDEADMGGAVYHDNRVEVRADARAGIDGKAGRQGHR